MSEPEIIERHLTIASAGSNAVDELAAASGLSKGKVKQLMQRGGVWHSRQQHTQRLRRAKRALQVGDELHLYYNEDVFNQSVPEAQLIADEGEYSIWYKPYGMRSQGSKWGDHLCIDRYVEQHIQPQRNAFIVHRLDRAATGLMVIAHSKKAAASLSALFAKREIEKRYQAIVQGKWSEDMTIDKPIDDKPAVSHVRVLEYSEKRDQTLVEVKIDTGRKHQIRKHLSGEGFPIVGDRLYGNAEAAKDGGTTGNAGAVATCRLEERDLQLCSVYLSFPCPCKDIDKSYDLPAELRFKLD